MYLVFDVGGTFIKYALMEEEGSFVEKSKFPTPRNKDDFFAGIQDIYEKYQARDLKGIAMSLPGLIDVDSGMVYYGGACRYLHEVNVKEALQEMTHLPVAIENDGKCAGLAETWLGNASHVDDAIIMMIGTGIGGAVIHNHRVLHGKHLMAGEFSALAINVEKDPNETKLLTDAASSTLCKKVAKEKALDVSEVSGEKVYAWASQGDDVCIKYLDEMYYELAWACYNFQFAFDPEIILFGGGISEQPSFIEGIRKQITFINEKRPQIGVPVIDVCKYKNDSNMIGALYHLLTWIKDHE